MDPVVPNSVLLILGALVLVSMVAWIDILRGLRRGEAIVRHEPHPTVAWGGAEVLALIVSIFVLQAAARQFTLEYYGLEHDVELAMLGPHVLATLLAANGAAMLTVLAIGVALFVGRGARRPRDFGLSLKGRLWLRDAGLALRAFFVALLPVYLLQMVLTQFFPKQHVVLELIRENHTPAMLAAAAFTVVLAAPLVEEFVFRLALQGWLETLEERRFARAAQADAEPAGDVPEPIAPLENKRGMVPVVVSSTVFALLHVGAGAAPVSLFPLALILGYLYLRTGRLAPCVMTHALFNGFNLGLLLLSM